jgi:branched-chain amino acid transport system substrate-binding protein
MGFGGGVPGLIGPDKPLSFRPSPAGAESIINNYAYLSEAYPNVKTLALINEEGPGGDFFGAVSKMQAEARGIKVVFNEMYPVGTKDFYPILTKAMAAKPDAMDIGVAFLEPLASMLKQGRELGYTGLMFTAGQPDMSLMLPIVGKEYADNYFSNCFDLASPSTPDTLEQIAQYYKDKGVDFKSDFMFQWDSAWCLAQAIQAAQSLDSTAIAAAWENIPSIETGFGTGHMGGLKTYGAKHLVLRPMPITALIKGEAKTVKWIVPDIP